MTHAAQPARHTPVDAGSVNMNTQADSYIPLYEIMKRILHVRDARHQTPQIRSQAATCDTPSQQPVRMF